MNKEKRINFGWFALGYFNKHPALYQQSQYISLIFFSPQVTEDRIWPSISSSRHWNFQSNTNKSIAKPQNTHEDRNKKKKINQEKKVTSFLPPVTGKNKGSFKLLSPHLLKRSTMNFLLTVVKNGLISWGWNESENT